MIEARSCTPGFTLVVGRAGFDDVRKVLTKHFVCSLSLYGGVEKSTCQISMQVDVGNDKEGKRDAWRSYAHLGGG
jgi:hypothetical protein